MANELRPARPAITLSLPLHLAKLANSLCKVDWPGQPTRYHLPGGWELSKSQRSEAKALLGELEAVINGTYLGAQNASKARLTLLTKMLLSYPVPGDASEAAADARLDLYDGALSDMPPWAIGAALKRWSRGECENLGMGALNYTFAPAPAVFRRLCLNEIEPVKDQVRKLTRLLAAVSLSRAMDPTPIQSRPDLSIIDETGRRLAVGLRRI
jgi:hypothetical protein